MKKKYIIGATAVVIIAGLVAAGAVKVHAQKNVGVAAKVNGEIVSVEEIKRGYEANPQIAAQVPFEEFYEKAVDIFVNGKLLYQAATKAQVEETPAYKEQLQAAKEDLARKVYLEQIVEAQVTPEAVQKFYDEEYVKKFESKKEMSAKHILLEDEKTAKEVIKKLNDGGDFDKLAKEYTKDRTIELGYFTEDLMVPEFSKAAAELEKGAYTKEPVQTQFGWHVIMLEDVRDSSPLSLEELEPQIKNMLSQNIVAETFDKLIKDAEIEKYDLKGNKLKEASSEEK